MRNNLTVYEVLHTWCDLEKVSNWECCFGLLAGASTCQLSSCNSIWRYCNWKVTDISFWIGASIVCCKRIFSYVPCPSEFFESFGWLSLDIISFGQINWTLLWLLISCDIKFNGSGGNENNSKWAGISDPSSCSRDKTPVGLDHLDPWTSYCSQCETLLPNNLKYQFRIPPSWRVDFNSVWWFLGADEALPKRHSST